MFISQSCLKKDVYEGVYIIVTLGYIYINFKSSKTSRNREFVFIFYFFKTLGWSGDGNQNISLGWLYGNLAMLNVRSVFYNFYSILESLRCPFPYDRCKLILAIERSCGRPYGIQFYECENSCDTYSLLTLPCPLPLSNPEIFLQQPGNPQQLLTKSLLKR